MKRLNQSQKKNLIKFVIITALSFIVFELVEHFVFEYFNIDIDNLQVGWLALMLFYGFKFHLICCLLPIIWATYKCRHNSCKHEHCENEKKQ